MEWIIIYDAIIDWWICSSGCRAGMADVILVMAASISYVIHLWAFIFFIIDIAHAIYGVHTYCARCLILHWNCDDGKFVFVCHQSLLAQHFVRLEQPNVSGGCEY